MKRRSMTAYGRAIQRTTLGRWSVDIQSVNRKGLDMNLQLPSNLPFFDPTIRKWLSECVERGQVVVRVGFEFLKLKEIMAPLKDLKVKWVSIAKGLGYRSQDVDFRFLMDRIDPQEIGAKESELVEDFRKVWKEAVAHWIEMKENEGRALVADLLKRMKHVKDELKKIEKLQPKVHERYRKKIEERMKELKIGVDLERLVREAALLAEKGAIDEEITRLYSHLEQMGSYLESKEKSVGRTLDFLAQEMGREINTLMAKAAETEIAKRGVVIKSEIEKIREQVQNIE